MPTKHGAHAYLTCMNILSQFYFLTPMDYKTCSKRKIWQNLKRAKSPKLTRPLPPDLVNMYISSTSFFSLSDKTNTLLASTSHWEVHEIRLPLKLHTDL